MQQQSIAGLFKELLDIPSEMELRYYLSNVSDEELSALCIAGEASPDCEFINDRGYLIDLITEKVINLKSAIQSTIQQPIDYFSNLPDEVILQILSYLGTSRRVGQASLVSRRFAGIGSEARNYLPYEPKGCREEQRGCRVSEEYYVEVFIFDFSNDGKLLPGPSVKYLDSKVWNCPCVTTEYFTEDIRMRKLKTSLRSQNPTEGFILNDLLTSCTELFTRPLSQKEKDYIFTLPFNDPLIKGNYTLTNQQIQRFLSNQSISLWDIVNSLRIQQGGNNFRLTIGIFETHVDVSLNFIEPPKPYIPLTSGGVLPSREPNVGGAWTEFFM